MPIGIEDFIEAVRRLLERRAVRVGEVINIGNPQNEMSIAELAEQIETLSAKFEDRLLPKKPWLSSKMTAGRLEALKKACVIFPLWGEKFHQS